MSLELQTCCGCIKLETGGKIISTIQIFGGILLLTGGSLLLESDFLEGFKFIFFGLVALMSGIFLLLGVLKNKPNFFVPYFVLCILSNIINYINIIVILHEALLATEEQNDCKLIGNILPEIVGAVLCFYFFVVIYSLFKQMKETSTN